MIRAGIHVPIGVVVVVVVFFWFVCLFVLKEAENMWLSRAYFCLSGVYGSHWAL